jgi:hypothetical protein
MSTPRDARKASATHDLSHAIGLDTEVSHGDPMRARPPRRSISDAVNAYVARKGLIQRVSDWAFDWLTAKHTRIGVLVFFLAGSAGAGYLWAAVFGEGFRGSAMGQAADGAPFRPDAVVAAVVATGLYVVGTAFSYMPRRAAPVNRRRQFGSFVATALFGLGLFGISRVFL